MGTDTVTYAQARALVEDALGPSWRRQGLPGDFATGAEGWQDATHYLVPFGARQWLEDGDNAFCLDDDAVAFVDKRTGVVQEVSGTYHKDRINAMRPAK